MFYSVLVSRAAKYGFAAGVACFVVILGVSFIARYLVYLFIFIFYSS